MSPTVKLEIWEHHGEWLCPHQKAEETGAYTVNDGKNRHAYLERVELAYPAGFSLSSFWSLRQLSLLVGVAHTQGGSSILHIPPLLAHMLVYFCQCPHRHV